MCLSVWAPFFSAPRHDTNSRPVSLDPICPEECPSKQIFPEKWPVAKLSKKMFWHQFSSMGKICKTKEKMEKNFWLLTTYSDSLWQVEHRYIGLRARGRGFAELWSLEPAIENNVILFTKIFSLLIPFQNHLRRKNLQSKRF